MTFTAYPLASLLFTSDAWHSAIDWDEEIVFFWKKKPYGKEIKRNKRNKMKKEKKKENKMKKKLKKSNKMLDGCD